MVVYQTFYFDGVYYSVDLLHVLIGRSKLKSIEVKLAHIKQCLCDNIWGDDSNPYSIVDVVTKPNKYKQDIARIKKANLKFPIILYRGIVVDGSHRLAKVYMQGKKTINAYNIDKSLLDKCAIGDKKQMRSITIREIISKFDKGVKSLS